MSEILALFFNPVFWFTAVVLALVVNLTSSFAYDGIRQFWGKYSSRQRAKNEERAATIEAEARKCVESPARLIWISSLLGRLDSESRNFQILFVIVLYLSFEIVPFTASALYSRIDLLTSGAFSSKVAPQALLLFLAAVIGIFAGATLIGLNRRRSYWIAVMKRIGELLGV